MQDTSIIHIIHTVSFLPITDLSNVNLAGGENIKKNTKKLLITMRCVFLYPIFVVLCICSAYHLFPTDLPYSQQYMPWIQALMWVFTVPLWFFKQKYYTKNQEWSYVLCIDWMSQISIYVSKSGYCRNYFFYR